MRKIIFSLFVMILSGCDGQKPQISCDNSQNSLEKAIIFMVLDKQLSEVNKLLDCGVNPNTQSNSQSLLMLAAGSHEVVNPDWVLVNEGAIKTISDAYQIIELLLAYGADPNIQSEKGYTALFSAVYHGRIGTVLALLEGGADITLRNVENKMAVDMTSNNLILQLFESREHSAEE